MGRYSDELLEQIAALRAENQKLREEVERLKHLHDLDHKLADQWQKDNERLREALLHEQSCRVCAEDGCEKCTECIAREALKESK